MAKDRIRDPELPRVPPALEAHADVRLDHEAELVEAEVRDLAAPALQARHLSFRKSRLTGWTLDGARLARPELRDVVLAHCSLSAVQTREASVARVVFDGCRMTGVGWAEATLEDVVFRGCQLDLASFGAATLRRVVFEDCVLREAELQDAGADQVQFLGCDLTGASFRRARFARSVLRGCRLEAIAGVEGLRGTALPWPELVGLAGTLAAALGIGVLDEEADS